MTIEDTDMVDSCGVDRATQELVLAISDHLPWDEDARHYDLLELKINSYLNYLSSGQYLEKHPEAAGMPVRIRLFCQYEPSPLYLTILNDLEAQLEVVGLKFSHAVLPPI